MSFQQRAESSIDYFPCRYGKSKLLFRGPRRKLDEAYVAVLGGAEAYGRSVEKPYPQLIEDLTGLRVANFGYPNAGPEVFLQDQAILELCLKAEATVIQVMGAQNVSNRFYSVHPRQNDHFASASQMLKTLYRDVDFGSITLTRQLLCTLQDRSPERFQMVVDEIRAAWVGRMRQLLAAAGGHKILLWVGEAPSDDDDRLDVLGPDPLFVTNEMIDELRGQVDDVVEVLDYPGSRGRYQGEGALLAEEDGLSPTDFGPEAHDEIAHAVSSALGRAMG